MFTIVESRLNAPRVGRGFKVAIFTPFLYPFHLDMAIIMNDKVETKIFTCGIYGNYPFGELLKCTETLKCITIAGQKIIGVLDMIKFLLYKPQAVIIFGIESLSGLMIYLISRLINAKTLVIVEENNTTRLNNIILELAQIMKRGIIRLVYKQVPILIAESYASKKYVLDILCTKRKKAIVVRMHGVNVDRFDFFSTMPKEYAKKVLQSILKLPEKIIMRKWVSFIGELSYCKGADILVDAIEIMQQSPKLGISPVFLLPKTNLLNDKKELREQYKQKIVKLMEKVPIIFYNPIEPKRMPLLYRASDIIVLPSRFLDYTSSDRSPNVALEALASGAILVASSVGGIPTIVEDAAVLIKPNNPHELATKLCQVLSNYEKYRNFEKKARERAIIDLDIKNYSHDLLKLLMNHS